MLVTSLKHAAIVANRLIGRVAAWLIEPPGWGVGLLMVWGVLLVVLSFALGVASTKTMAAPCLTVAPCLDFNARQLGFFFAPNWSLTAIGIWPAMYFALAGMLKQASQVCRTIDDSPMSWLSKPREPSSVSHTWEQHRTALAVVISVLLFTTTIASLSEWWSASGSVMIGGRPLGSKDELDWSIAMLGRGTLLQYANAGLAMLAYLYQAVVLVMLFTFLGVTLLMARTIGRHGSGSASPPLLVDIGSNDPSSRLGFEKFVLMIDYMILFVFLAYTNFILTRIQNAYLRSPNADSLLSFLEQDLALPSTDHLNRLFAVERWDWSSSAVSIGAIIVLFQCFFFFNASLRHAAIQARNRSDQALLAPALLKRAKRYEFDVKEIQARLRGANVWPLGYSDIAPTLSLLLLCMLSILFYRIGIYLVLGWVVSRVILRTAVGIVKKSG